MLGKRFPVGRFYCAHLCRWQGTSSRFTCARLSRRGFTWAQPIMLVLLTGVAEMPYALPPKLSAKLRADLQAAESATKPRCKTRSAKRGAQ
jgi:hypothetical protein